MLPARYDDDDDDDDEIMNKYTFQWIFLGNSRSHITLK